MQKEIVNPEPHLVVYQVLIALPMFIVICSWVITEILDTYAHASLDLQNPKLKSLKFHFLISVYSAVQWPI